MKARIQTETGGYIVYLILTKLVLLLSHVFIRNETQLPPSS